MTRSAAQRLTLGQVVGCHGIRGQLRVRYFGDGPDNLLRQEEVWLAYETGDPKARRYRVIESGTGRAREVRMLLEGIDGREGAEAMRSLYVEAGTADLEPLAEGEYYWHQLVGCRVEGHDGTPVGVVKEILETGAHDVLVVEDVKGTRHLIPTARELLREIDLDAGRLVVELLPGLLEGD